MPDPTELPPDGAPPDPDPAAPGPIGGSTPTGAPPPVAGAPLPAAGAPLPAAGAPAADLPAVEQAPAERPWAPPEGQPARSEPYGLSARAQRTDWDDWTEWNAAARRPRRGLRLALVAALVVGAVGTAGGLVLRATDRPGSTSATTGTDGPDAVGSEPGLEATTAARAALLDLLDARAAAVLAKDKPAYLATMDPKATGFRARQSKAFDSLVELPLRSWEYAVTVADPFEIPAGRRTALGASAWTVEVALRYQLDGFDQAKSRLKLYYTVVQRNGRWYIASDRDGADAGRSSQVGLWDLGKITVVRGTHSLVLGLRSTVRLRPFAVEADAAVPRVTEIWGSDWPGKVIIVVPNSQSQMERLAGVDEDYYDQIAAVTRRENGRDSDESAGDRVIINPSLWAQLGSYGRQVVMTHEITHVATHDASGSTPTWLSEGFADYVAYVGVPVSVPVIGQDLFASIRRGRLPRTLPTSRDFAPSNDRLAEAYEGAWLACKLLADRYGEGQLVTFYRMVGEADGIDEEEEVDQAFQSVFELTTKKFTSQWRSYLRDLAE